MAFEISHVLKDNNKKNISTRTARNRMKSASLMSTWSMRLIRNINKTRGFYLDVIETEGPDAGSIR